MEEIVVTKLWMLGVLGIMALYAVLYLVFSRMKKS